MAGFGIGADFGRLREPLGSRQPLGKESPSAPRVGAFQARLAAAVGKVGISHQKCCQIRPAERIWRHEFSPQVHTPTR